MQEESIDDGRFGKICKISYREKVLTFLWETYVKEEYC